METVTAPRLIVLARNAASDLRVLGTFNSDTDAQVFIAGLKVRHPQLSCESVPLFGLRQASALATDLLARESPAPVDNQPPTG
jgi:hypothetical protein